MDFFPNYKTQENNKKKKKKNTPLQQLWNSVNKQTMTTVKCSKGRRKKNLCDEKQPTKTPLLQQQLWLLFLEQECKLQEPILRMKME
jgi:hypothetical protein